MAAVESRAGAQQLISRLSAQLSSCLNKENLVKSLKQAVNELQRLKQMKSLSRAMRPLSDTLIKQGLLQHKDKNIRLLVATCFCEIMRVLAPDSDPHFSAEVLRDIFNVILSIFRETDDTRSPNFSARLKLLETFDKLHLCTLMLDNGCEDLVLEMFKIFFSVVRKQHPYSMINAMSSIMTCALEEKDLEPLVLQPLLDVIFQNLLKEAKGASAGSALLVVSVIESFTEKCPMSTFLRSCISSRDIIASDVKESYHEIIYEIFQINPKMLPLVIPSLSQELLTDQVDVRIKALKLIRKLFALPGHNISQEYHPLFMEFMNRFSDKSSEVRSCALSCAKAWYERIPCGKGSDEVLSAVQSRLLDFDDRVRIEAVTLVCDLARCNLNSFPSGLIYHVADRLRDKKVSVRKKALQKLLELYRDYCTKCVEDPLIIWDHFEHIPCKILMLCFDKDCKEFSPQSLELVLAEDLFPDSLSIEDRTKHWIYLFSLLKPIQLKALNTILSQKRRLRDTLQAYLYLWNQDKDTGSEVTERRMRALIAKMSASFPDAGQAEVLFQKLKEVKDNDILRFLKEMLNVGDAHSVRDQLLGKIGGDNPLFEFLRLLSSLCLLNVFSSGHVSCIVDNLTAGDHLIGDKNLKDSAVQLLLTIISAFPSLLRSSVKKFQEILVMNAIPFNGQLIQILAKEGSSTYIELSDIYCLLEGVCLEGTRMDAKLAVAAIKTLSGSSEQIVFSNLCKMLLDSLRLNQNIPTALQSLGCIAQHCPSAYEDQEEEIVCYILQEVFSMANLSQSNDMRLSAEKSDCCKSCELKIYGLKTLVRGFLPNTRAPVNRNLTYLLDIITNMLQTGSFSDRTDPCHSDKDNIQLAAAKSILTLSRRWDLHISPVIFRLTMLVAKDNSLLVRRVFVNKVHKLLKEHAVPSRYACAFSFSSTDLEDDLHDNSLKFMGAYVKSLVKRAGIDNTGPLSGSLINHPAYMIVFLVHVLAHDTAFPTVDCPDKELYLKPASPLLFSIQALLNTEYYDKNSEVVNTALYLRSIFSAIKRAEDATDPQVTPKLHLLADLGISFLHSSDHNTAVLTTGNPEFIWLPSSLYKVGPVDKGMAYCTSSSLNVSDETLIRKSNQTLGTTTSQEDSMMTDAHKRSKSNSTPYMRSSAPRTEIIEQRNKSYQKDLVERSDLDTDVGGTCLAISSLPPRASILHNDFSIGDENDMYAVEACEVNCTEQLPSSSDSVATKNTLGQKEVISSCSLDRDVITRATTRPTKFSKLDAANKYKLRMLEASKEEVEKLAVKHLQQAPAIEKRDAEHSSYSSGIENCDFNGRDYTRKPLQENMKICSNWVPPLVAEKEQRSKNAPSKENVGRRMRKRKTP